MTFQQFIQTSNYQAAKQAGYSDEEIKDTWETKYLSSEYKEFVNSDTYATVSQNFSDEEIQSTWETKYGTPSFTGGEVDTAEQGRQAFRQTPEYRQEFEAGRTDIAIQRDRDIKQEQRSVQPQVQGGVLDIIAKGEGVTEERATNAGYATPYDITLGYGKFDPEGAKPLTEMTIAEVYAHQKAMKKHPQNRFPDGKGNSSASSAVGRFQIIEPTLRGLVSELGLSEDTVFSQEVQDQMGNALLNRRGYDEYLAGEIDITEFQSRMSNEWASIADPSTGKSRYGQHTGVSVDEFKSMIDSPAGSVTEAPTDLYSRFTASPEYKQLRESGMTEEQVRNAFDSSLNPAVEEAVEPTSSFSLLVNSLRTGTSNTVGGMIRGLQQRASEGTAVLGEPANRPLSLTEYANNPQRGTLERAYGVDNYEEYLAHHSKAEQATREDLAADNARIAKVADWVENLTPQEVQDQVAAASGGAQAGKGALNTWIATIAPNIPRLLGTFVTAAINPAIPMLGTNLEMKGEYLSTVEQLSEDLGIEFDEEAVLKASEQYALPAGAMEYVDNMLDLAVAKTPLAGIAKKIKSKVALVAGTLALNGLTEGVTEISQESLKVYRLGQMAAESGVTDEQLARIKEYATPDLVRVFIAGAGSGIVLGGGGMGVQTLAQRFADKNMTEEETQLIEDLQAIPQEEGTTTETSPLDQVMEEASEVISESKNEIFNTVEETALIGKTRGEVFAQELTEDELAIFSDEDQEFDQEELDIISGADVQIETPQTDAQKQTREIKLHQEHMSNLLGREVSEIEAASDWTVKTDHQKESLAELYRDRHIVGTPVVAQEAQEGAEATNVTQEAIAEQEGIAEDVTEVSEEAEVVEVVTEAEVVPETEQVVTKELREETKETEKKERSPLASPLKKEIDKERKEEVSEGIILDNIIRQEETITPELSPKEETTEDTQEALISTEATQSTKVAEQETVAPLKPLTGANANLIKSYVGRIPGVSVEQGSLKSGTAVISVSTGGKSIEQFTISNKDLDPIRDSEGRITTRSKDRLIDLIEERRSRVAIEKVAKVDKEIVKIEDLEEKPETSKIRVKYTEMSNDDFRTYLGSSTGQRLGAISTTLSEEAVTQLRETVAKFGPTAINTLTQKELTRITGEQARSFTSSDKKATELTAIKAGPVEFDSENKNHQAWAKSRVVDIDVVSNVELSQVKTEDFTEGELETLISSITNPDEIVMNADLRTLAEKGVVTITMSEGTTKARGGKDTRFNETLRGLEVGSGAVGAAISLDQISAEAATFASEGTGIDISTTDEANLEDDDFGFEDDTIDEFGDQSSSWQLFNRKGRGTVDKQVEVSDVRILSGNASKIVNDAVSKVLPPEVMAEFEIENIGSERDLYAARTLVLQSPLTSPESLLSASKADAVLSKLLPKVAPKAGSVRSTISRLKQGGAKENYAASLIEAVVDTTGIDQFDLSIEALENLSGYFDGIDNAITLDSNEESASAIAHEIGHWAFTNLLTAEQRAGYTSEFIEKFYTDGTLDKAAVTAGLNLGEAGSNVLDDINEVFAEHFAQYVLKQEDVVAVTSTKTKSLFEKLKDVFRNLWRAIRGSKHVDPLFDKYIQLALSKSKLSQQDQQMFETVSQAEITERPVNNPLNYSKKTDFTGKKEADAKKRATERAVADAYIESEIAKLGTRAESVDELRHRFIAFAIQTIPKGPIRKNFLKTVQSIKTTSLKDPSYKHAIMVTNRYAEARTKDQVMGEFRKLLAPSRYKKLEGEQIAELEEFMGQYDLAKINAKTLDRLASEAEILYNKDPRIASSQELIVHQEEINRLTKTPLRNLTSENMIELLARVQEIYATSKAASKARKEGRANSIQAGADDITNSIESRADELTKAEFAAQKGVVRGVLREALKGAKKGLSVFANIETIANIIDGEDGGAIHRQIIQPVVDGLSEGVEYAHSAEDFLADAIITEDLDVTNWSENQHSGLANKTFTKEVKRGLFRSGARRFGMTKAEQVSFVRLVGDSDALNHMVNDGLIVGEDREAILFTPESIHEIFQSIDDDVFRLANVVGEYYVMEGNYLNNFIKKTTGAGIDVDASHHPMISKEQADRRDQADFNTVGEVTGRMNQRSFQKGSTKARVKGATGAILLEDIFVTQARTAREAGTFVGLSKTIPYVTNVLNKSKETMDKKGLSQEFKMMKNVVDQIGTPNPAVITGPTISKAYNGLRKIFISGKLGFKAVVSALQTVSAGNYVTMAEQENRAAVLARTPVLVAKYFKEYMANLKDDSSINEEMFKLSPMVRERFESGNIDRDMGETGNQANARRVLNRVVTKTTGRKVTDKISLNTPMTPISFMDKVAIRSMFDLVKMEADMLGIEEEQRDAWIKEKMERSIRQTQPTFSEFDKSEILRSPILKEFTMFASQRSKNVNMVYRAIAKINEGKVAEGLTELAWVGVAVPAMITALKLVWKTARGKDEEDDKDIEEFFRSMITSTIGNLPVIGDAINNFINDTNFPMGGAMVAQVTSLVGFGNAVKSGDSERIAKNAERLSTNVGFPSGLIEIKDVIVNVAEEFEDGR